MTFIRGAIYSEAYVWGLGDNAPEGESWASKHDYRDAVCEHIGRLRGRSFTGYTDLPDAGGHNDEDLWNPDTDKYDPRKLKVTCPGCGVETAPLCSPYTWAFDGGWRWVGLDHKEPFSRYWTRHRCGQEYCFTTYTPQ